MSTRVFVVGGGLVWVLAATVTAALGVGTQAPAAPTVDFVRDVQPILRQSCYSCHGPAQQMNGFRLDRRRDALRGGTEVVIGPGNSDASKLYLRLIGHQFGAQMPPTGALTPEQIAIIKRWIDQGADWPDHASGEAPPTPQHPAAAALVDLLRRGDFRTFRSRIAREAALVNARGAGGSTMLMFAALYGDAATVRDLITRGAAVNAKNDVGATALMWAVADADTSRTLVEQGADVNARSEDGRTPLLMAAGSAGSTATVKLLLERGAQVNVSAPSLFGASTPLVEAAYIGNEDAFRLILDAGADLKVGAPVALLLSQRAACRWCVDALAARLPEQAWTPMLVMSMPPIGPALGAPQLLERGASVEPRDPAGRNLLMLAAASEAMPVEAVKALIARKLDVNEQTASGETALNLARRHGRETPVVRALLDAGARDEALPLPPTFAPAGSVREALQRAVPLLQKSDVTFLSKSGCVSCHNNSLTAMTLTNVRKHGLRVDEAIAADQTRKIAAYLESWRERAVQGIGIPGDVDTVSYILTGLAAANHPPDLATDAHAYFIKRQQAGDGRWRVLVTRPPIESSDFEVTAAAIRALRVYAPAARRAEYERSISAATNWLRTATPRVTEDRAFQLLGLHWAGASTSAIQAAARATIAHQRPDGGWSQLPTMESDAYATGQTLVALVESGALATSDVVYRRGVEFLLKTQLADGSWFVRTRAIAIQPLFDAGFPHGRDAFISAAATNWAAMALALGPRTRS